MLLYAKGQGVPKDMAKALKWSKKTAEGGIDWAPKNVAEIEKYIQERAAKTKPKATRQYYLIDGALACISPAHLTNYMAVLGSGIMADPRDHKCVRSTGKRVPIVLGETVHMGGYEMVQFRNSAGTFTGWTLETNTDS